MSFENSLDREAQVYRLPEMPDLSGPFGDENDSYQLLGTVACRIELSDNDYWIVWTTSEDIVLEHQDQLVFANGLTVYVRRVKPFTTLSGDTHHFEVMAHEDPDDQRWANRGG